MGKRKDVTDAAVAQARLRADLKAEQNRFRLEDAKAKALKRLGDATGAKTRGARRVRFGGGAEEPRRGPMAFTGSFASSRTSRTRKPLGSGSSGSRSQVGSADAHLDEVTHDAMRRDSQDLFRNSPIARVLVNRKVALLVGDGSTVAPKSSSKDFNDAVLKLWKAYWSTLGLDPVTGVHGVDCRGMSSGPQWEKLTTQQALVDGDLLAIPLTTAAVQLIDGARIVSDSGGRSSVTDDWTRGVGGGGGGGESAGVLLDRVGKAVGFRVADYAAGGAGIDPGSKSSRIVPASAAWWVINPCGGRSGGVNQTRGEPMLTAVYDLVVELHRYINTVGVAAYVSSCFAAFIKSVNPAERQAQMEGQPVTTTNEDGTETERRDVYLEPGIVQHLETGEDVTFGNPGQPTTQFDAYVRSILRIICAHAGLPLLTAFFDASGVNLSTARALALSMAPELRAEQDDRVTRLLSPLYRFCVALWVRQGKLKSPPADWDAHEWTVEPLPILDPEAEARTAKLMMDALMSTGDRQSRQMTGVPYEVILRERAKEISLEKELGVDRVHAPGAQVAEAAANGNGPAEKPEPGEEPDEN